MAEGWNNRKVGRQEGGKVGCRAGWSKGRQGGGNVGRKVEMKVVGKKTGRWTKIDIRLWVPSVVHSKKRFSFNYYCLQPPPASGTSGGAQSSLAVLKRVDKGRKSNS